MAAVLAALSFAKTMVAFCLPSASEETSMLVMAPQKEKKSGGNRKQQIPMSMFADNEAPMCD